MLTVHDQWLYENQLPRLLGNEIQRELLLAQVPPATCQFTIGLDLDSLENAPGIGSLILRLQGEGILEPVGAERLVLVCRIAVLANLPGGVVGHFNVDFSGAWSVRGRVARRTVIRAFCRVEEALRDTTCAMRLDVAKLYREGITKRESLDGDTRILP